MNEQTVIALGSDHAGFALKRQLRDYLDEMGIRYIDYGCFSGEAVDYPDFAYRAAMAVASRLTKYGIVICGTGIGVSITANKVAGIRAALCCTPFMAELARKHNDANMLALGARTTTHEQAIEIVEIFLKTPFEGNRHKIRVEKIHLLSGR